MLFGSPGLDSYPCHLLLLPLLDQCRGAGFTPSLKIILLPLLVISSLISFSFFSSPYFLTFLGLSYDLCLLFNCFLFSCLTRPKHRILFRNTTAPPSVVDQRDTMAGCPLRPWFDRCPDFRIITFWPMGTYINDPLWCATQSSSHLWFTLQLIQFIFSWLGLLI